MTSSIESIVVNCVGDGDVAGLNDALNSCFQQCNDLRKEYGNWYHYLTPLLQLTKPDTSSDNDNGASGARYVFEEVEMIAGIMRCMSLHLNDHYDFMDLIPDDGNMDIHEDFLAATDRVGYSAARLRNNVGRRRSARHQGQLFANMKANFAIMYEMSVANPKIIDILLRAFFERIDNRDVATHRPQSTATHGDAIANLSTFMQFEPSFSPQKCDNITATVFTEAPTLDHMDYSGVSDGAAIKDIDSHLWKDVVRSTFDYLTMHKSIFRGGGFVSWMEHLDHLHLASSGAFNATLIALASRADLNITMRQDRLLIMMLQRSIAKEVIQSVMILPTGIGRLRRLHQVYGQTSVQHRALLMQRFYSLSYRPAKMSILEHLNSCVKMTTEARLMGNIITNDTFQGVVIRSFKPLQEYSLLRDIFARWWNSVPQINRTQMSIAVISDQIQKIMINSLDVVLNTRLVSTYHVRRDLGGGNESINNVSESEDRKPINLNNEKKNKADHQQTVPMTSQGYKLALLLRDARVATAKANKRKVYRFPLRHYRCIVKGCKGRGHWAEHCPKLRKFKDHESEKPSSPESVSSNQVSNDGDNTDDSDNNAAEAAHLVALDDIDTSMLGTYHIGDSDGKSGWLLDSGSAVHITPCKSDLHDTRETNMSFATADGNGRKLQAVLQGHIFIRTSTNVTLRVEHVYYVPNVGRRILSCELLETELKLFQKNVFDGDTVIARYLHSRDGICA